MDSKCYIKQHDSGLGLDVHNDLFEKHTEQCLAQMLKICKEHFSKEMELLKTIPGVSDTSAMIIMAETGGDTCTVYKFR